MIILDQGIFNLEISNGTACMNFNSGNPKYSKELILSSWNREIKFLDKILKYPWAPEDLKIDHNQKKLSFKWYGNTCETVLPNNWKNQLEQIVNDLKYEKIYKPNFYQKCFYVDNSNQIHAFVFYSSSSYDEQPIDIDFYRPILNDDRLKTVEQLSSNNKLDMKLLIERAFTDYIVWPENALVDIYKKVYG